jgi:hypothetical protein
MFVWWMIGVCGASWLAAAFLFGAIEREVLLGMLGPLGVACLTWVLAERTYRMNPERLTSLMLKAFAGKMVFFAAYVALMLSVLMVRPVPFVASFSGYFIALHLMEALRLRRMFAEDMRPSR